MQIGDKKRSVTPHPRLMLHVIILRFQHDEAGLKVILYQRCDMGAVDWLTATA
jgi:hypothetical protein